MEKPTNSLKELCLEITNACPLNCLHCSGNCGSHSTSMLSLGKIKEIITAFKALGGQILEISGGEPLLHSELIDILKFANEEGLSSILYSSGNLLDAGLIAPINARLAAALYETGLRKIIFNLQGTCSSIHEILTQTAGSYSNVLTSIQNVKTAGFWVGIHFVPTKLNYKEISNMYGFCNHLQINELGILRFVPQGRGRNNERILQLSLTEFNTLNRSLKIESSKKGFSTMRLGRPIDFRFKENIAYTKGRCDAGLTRCSIAPDGRVVPCPAFKEGTIHGTVIGNINEKTLIDIWSDPKWQTFRNFDYKKMGEPCKSCDYLEQCQGGCKAQRLLKQTNLYSGPDPCCECSMLKWVLDQPDQEAPRRLLPVQ